ncbi:hypothetical protein HanXRQr2_Chr13g0570131 [Helianthus annuus]|uniref:Uncharacterized protein n=1 Tax=Helianthus annuus TaxID=4232 RepID=A0A9K3EEX4_HELAN|nr:hypothetical protein HanXRQr2_Chr13g0570131 [Helianthus annuus]KAJ0847758.1 hypothetical protein HanPSC8_Chr13g0548961 [Helianthus annuus]
MYVMSSSCVGEMMSSEFRDCDFCLDESQVLNCVFNSCLMVVSYEQDFYYVIL